jgi:undecaprenyl-diphosphatase
MNAFAGAVVIGKRWRKALIILLYLAAAIAYSRVYIGVHYPFDVVSGAIIGVLIGLLACNLDGMRLVRWTEGKMQNVGDAFSKGRNAH